MKSYQQLFAELKRRHVFRVAAVYGGVAFALIQVADPLVKALMLPDAFLTYVAAILILGFPLALVLAWAFEVTPDGVRKTAAATDAEIAAIVAEPAAKRWPSGLLALLGVGLLVAGAWWVGRRSGADALAMPGNGRGEAQLAFTDPSADDRPSIAVLPFEDLSPEGDQAYFSDGMTEEILGVLAKVRELRVSARTSVFALKDVDLTATQVGDTLRVRYFVEGSVRKAGNQLRITAQLIDAEDGSQLWSESYDRELVDVFAIQGEIARSIAAELRIPLGLEDGERLVTPTGDLAAYDLYLAGRARMRERGASLEEAVRLFEAAIARDSGWAPAWAGLAESRSLIPFYQPAADRDWEGSLAAAEVAANRALALDPRNASATVALGNMYRDSWQWEKAERAYLRALELDPDNGEAHQQYAEYLGYVGRVDEAYEAALRALALDRSPIRLNVAAYLARNNEMYDRSAELLDEGIRLDRDRRVGFLRVNRAYLHMFRDSAAVGRDLFFEYLELYASPDLIERFERAWPTSVDPPGLPTPAAAAVAAEVSRVDGAAMWMALGEHERAIESLTRERPPFGQTDPWWVPWFDPIRDDPRMIAAKKAWGLEGFEVRRKRLD